MWKEPEKLLTWQTIFDTNFKYIKKKWKKKENVPSKKESQRNLPSNNIKQNNDDNNNCLHKIKVL